MAKLSKILATLFGLGHSPIVPGTVGTMLGLPVYFLLYQLGNFYFAIALIIISFVSIPICGRAAKEHFNHSDPSPVVLDELCGFLVTLAFHEPNSANLAIGFILFRIFDIAKFWPMSAAEKLQGGLGIVADDLIAGVFANVSLIAIIMLFNL